MSTEAKVPAAVRAATIRHRCTDLERIGVPESATAPIREYAASLVCEGCDGAATSGPHDPDGVYLCDDCLRETDEEWSQTNEQP